MGRGAATLGAGSVARTNRRNWQQCRLGPPSHRKAWAGEPAKKGGRGPLRAEASCKWLLASVAFREPRRTPPRPLGQLVWLSGAGGLPHLGIAMYTVTNRDLKEP